MGIFKKHIKHTLLFGIVLIIILSLGIALFLPNKVFCYNLGGKLSDTIDVQNPIYQVPVPNNLTFAGEKVPVSMFDVRESLDRELHVNTYWHSQTVLLIKRANRFFPIIEPILEEKGLPNDFKYLAVAESALTHAVSPAGAVGFWQILEGTGKELGLEINDEVDERYHIEKSTYAACDFLIRSYNLYGNWTMAAASYNFGRNGINRQMVRQNNINYYDMVLGEEAERYLFRIIAFKVIFENQDRYGFFLREQDLYPPLDFFEVPVDSSVTSFAQFAEHFNTNYKMLKLLNPWLRESYLSNPNSKNYSIKILEPKFRESAYK